MGLIAGRRSGDTVALVFDPPLEFIVGQQGAFRRALGDFSRLWDRFAPIMSDIERRWFESEGEGGWPELAESTLARKLAAGFSSKPLRTTDGPGTLYDTLTDPQLAGKQSGSRFEWSTGVPYAHFHQDGGDVPGRPPQRQVIPDPLPLADRRLLEQATVSWINEAAAQAFGGR